MGNSPDWGGQEIHVNQRESIYVNDSSAPCRPSNQKQPLMFNSHSNMLSHLHVFAYASSKHVYWPTHLHDCILIMLLWRHRWLVSTIFCNVWCKSWKGNCALTSDLIRTVIIIYWDKAHYCSKIEMSFPICSSHCNKCHTATGSRTLSSKSIVANVIITKMNKLLLLLLLLLDVLYWLTAAVGQCPAGSCTAQPKLDLSNLD